MIRSRKLVLAHLAVAFTAFGAAAMMAVMQAVSRTGSALPGRTEQIYYLSVTAHGVLMALIFTTFFIMGLGYFVVETTTGKVLASRVAWGAFWTALLGTVTAAVPILLGKASVLYTFYPPLQAHPAFYIGLALVVVGSWGWAGLILSAYRAFRRDHPDLPAPLPLHGMVTTAILWILASLGVAVEVVGLLIPWSLGLTKTIDPLLARALFWYFGHPLVYFWLLPAYLVWYAILPAHVEGKLFSDKLARVVFISFLVLSAPVGFHHQLMDPGISAGWKLLHVLNTFAILLPSFITAFTVLASLEVAGRRRGGTGLFGWLGKLPWGEPFFTSVLLSMLLFAVGGFGGAVNAAYGMNAMVHNTAWVQGHFHLTVGSAAALTFMGVSYWMVPRLTGRRLRFAAWGEVQPVLWFAGMLLFAIANHVTGLLGMPRRVYEAGYGGAPAAVPWGALTTLSAIGGTVLFVSAMSFLLVMIGTALWGAKIEPPPVAYAEPLTPPLRQSIWDRFGLWTVLAVALVLIAYAVPFWQLLQHPAPGSPGFHPF